MAFQLSLTGRWRLNVIMKEAAFDQRFVVLGSANADGTYPGIIGTNVEVAGRGQQPWTLKIQHNDGSGWDDSELRETPRVTNGSQITFNIESEDLPQSSNPDFNDLVLRSDKVGMIEIPFRPYALRIDTLQMMPDGIFEAALGNYYMAVRVQNVWTQMLPADSLIGISTLGRSMLAAGGIQVVDAWVIDEQELLGQKISGNRVVLGTLAPWEMRTVYFKVNCAAARPRKHSVEFELTQPAMLDPTHPNRRTSQKIFASRSSYNPVTKEFAIECDQGRMFLKLREVAVEFTTLRDAIRCARDHRAKHGDSLEDSARKILKDLLEGKQVDLCELKRLFDCICSSRGKGDGDGGGKDGNRDQWPCGDIPVFPTKFDYRVELNQSYTGQFGPLPFDDPWWKVLLIILAIILTVAAGASAASDLAYKSDDVVVGQLKASVLNALKTRPGASPPSMDSGSVDAALVELNGQRNLTASVFSYLDAASDEANTDPISTLNGQVHTNGTILTNAQIDQIFQNLRNNPNNQAAKDAVKVYKSGARTGLTRAIMTGIVPIYPRAEKDGNTIFFVNQISFLADPDAPTTIARPGDSGSLWLQRGTNTIVALNHAGCSMNNTAGGCRIEDVMKALNIRFA